MERQIPLQGIKNIRDFGGIVNKYGKTIQKGLLIRSCSLHKITPKDAEILAEIPITRILDLRTPSEREEKPDKAVRGAVSYALPVFSDAVMGISHEKKTTSLDLLKAMPDLADLYRIMVSQEECVAALRTILQKILQNGEGAVLWHCTEGKDRCGIVSALVLCLLDVDVDTVYHDYLLTKEAPSKRGIRSYRAVKYILRDREKAEKVKRLFSAEKEFLDAAFHEIVRLYGSVESFLQDVLNVTPEQKKAFQERVLLS